jgi:hypothetical protein
MCGLYRGFSAAACREMSYSSLRFGMYEPVKIMLGAGEPGGPAWKSVTAGLVAGVGAAAVASPTDLLTVRMMKHEGAPLGLGETARALVSEGGFFALYRGMDVTMVRAAILGGTKMATCALRMPRTCRNQTSRPCVAQSTSTCMWVAQMTS